MRPDIFIKEQFVPKAGPDRFGRRFIDERQKLIIEVLSNSVLGSWGLVKAKDIRDDFVKGKVDKYKAGGLSVLMLGLLVLELYLQKNNIK